VIKRILFGTVPDANIGTLLLRLFIGGAMMTHGLPKMFGGLPGFTAAVGGMGFPLPHLLAFLAAFAESFGALFLLLGLLTRPAAFLIACTMAVAALGVHGGEPFANQELAWLYFFPALLFLLKGAGTWSLDARITAAK
jgi:putative oxidoreductase